MRVTIRFKALLGEDLLRIDGTVTRGGVAVDEELAAQDIKRLWDLEHCYNEHSCGRVHVELHVEAETKEETSGQS